MRSELSAGACPALPSEEKSATAVRVTWSRFSPHRFASAQGAAAWIAVIQEAEQAQLSLSGKIYHPFQISSSDSVIPLEHASDYCCVV